MLWTMNKLISMIRFFILSTLSSLLFVVSLQAAEESKPYIVNKLIVLDIDATINPAISHYLKTEITRLAPDDPSIIIVKINTPGGLVSTTKKMITTIGEANHPIIVWVTPEGASATSAGAIVASAAHGLVMNRGTNIGAATPVGMGEDIKEGDGRSKAVNDLSALVKSLSETRGRNAEAFSQMISSAASYPSQEALKLGIIDGITSNLDDIRALYQGREITVLGQKRIIQFAPVIETEIRSMDVGLNILNVLAHPTTAYILFVLGAALLYFEFQAPGGYIAGGFGALFLLMAGMGFQVLPLNFFALMLMFAGVILLILEVFITSYGLLALSGLACFGAGSLFLFRHEDSFMTIHYPVMYSTLLGVITAVAFMTYIFMKKTTKVDFYTHHDKSAEIMNELQKVDQYFIYQVRVAGEIWKARSLTQYSKGDKVIVEQAQQDSFILEIK
jgi:membrane-bound serine protease (ClpP class)